MYSWGRETSEAHDVEIAMEQALACLTIIVDAEAAGQLEDDRQIPGGYPALIERLTPHVARLKKHHAGRTHHHYTIADAEEAL
jgi:hypothetical protein